jgi:hypothetical protein
MLRVRSLDDTAGLRLTGETDVSNRDCLAAMLAELPGAAADRSPTVDVSGLHFADVAAAHSLVVAAVRAGALRVVGASAQLARLISFVGGDRTPQLTVETRPAHAAAPLLAAAGPALP